MHCLVLAGGINKPDDPLYPLTEGRPKALLDMAGQPMLSWVLSALQMAHSVQEIVVVGLTEEEAVLAGVQVAQSIHYLPDAGSMLNNLRSGTSFIRQHWPATEAIMGASADIPAITGAVVDAFYAACQPLDRDIYYNFVTREAMEARFPGAARTYTRLGPLEVAGGDLNIATLAAIDRQQALYEAVTNARKHPWRIARLVGWSVLLRLLLQRLTLDDVQRTAERVTGQRVAVLVSEHAELAMDADKPHQVEILRADLARVRT